MSALHFVYLRIILISSTRWLRTSSVISFIHCRYIAFIIEFNDVVLINAVPALYMMECSYFENIYKVR